MFFKSVSEAFSWSTRVSSSADNSPWRQITTRHPNKCSMALADNVPLFFWRRDLFIWTKSSLFACISGTSLWYWAKAPSSLDCSRAECFLALEYS
jgi:hypothetical protein